MKLSKGRGALLAVLVVGVSVLLAEAETPQRTYVKNDANCAISSFSLPATDAKAKCNGALISLLPASSLQPGVQEPYNAIVDTFQVDSTSTFTVEFRANGSLTVMLTDLSTGVVTFQVDESDLSATSYPVMPGKYALAMANSNNFTIGFTITAYY